MIPLAFDLISIFVIGSTLPVATTDLTIVPRSTAARCEASTSAAAPLSVARPAAPPSDHGGDSRADVPDASGIFAAGGSYRAVTRTAARCSKGSAAAALR